MSKITKQISDTSGIPTPNNQDLELTYLNAI